MALDPNDPFTVYVSAQSNPSVLSSSFLLSQIKLDAANPAGALLSSVQISASGVDSFRPSVPEGLLQGDQTVLYASGSYHYYANSGAPYYNAGYTAGTNVGYSTNILAWTAVPEPGTLSLLALGAAGLLLLRRRR